jgi:hypothetical protein
LAGDLFRDIRELEKELTTIQNKKKDLDKLDDWYSRYFNTLEWFSFLINEKKISDKKIIDYFKPLIIESYEEQYLDPERRKRDPDQPKDLLNIKN